MPIVTRATYNITDDRLKVWFDERLSAEDYAKIKAADFSWWPGRKCFAVTWRPAAEDAITAFGGVIESDDDPDDLESRVERFEERAARELTAANSAKDYLDSGKANTDRRRENASRRVEGSLEAAEHWKSRIAGAVRNAAKKDDPGVIKRRIDGLEADRRRHVASYTPQDDQILQQSCGPCVFVGPKGRGGHWVRQDLLPALKRWADRWTAHIDRRLEYERAYLEAAGGNPGQKNDIQVGGKILAFGGWATVIRVNRSPATKQVTSVTLDQKPGRYWSSVVSVEDIDEYQAASAESAADAKKATKLPPLVNYPGDGFHHMTKDEYDRRVRRQMGATWSIPGTGDYGKHRQRRAALSFADGSKFVYITDMPTKERPKATAQPLAESESSDADNADDKAARELEADLERARAL
jgi:hypothetical protein